MDRGLGGLSGCWQRIEQLAPGYGYLLSSANSVAEYCKPENVAAMIETVREFGRY